MTCSRVAGAKDPVDAALFAPRSRGIETALVEIFEIVDRNSGLGFLSAATDDLCDREQQRDRRRERKACPRDRQPGHHQDGDAESLTDRVVPQKPYEGNGFFHLGSSFS
jgi:hypothetical protein